MPDPTPAYQTRLEREPLPEILAKLAHHKVPASIECRRGAERALVFVSDGELNFACMGDAEEAFRDIVVGSGLVSDTDFVHACALSRKNRQTIGEALVADGKTDGTRLAVMVEPSVRDALENLFAWNEGEVEFRFGRIPLPVRLSVPIERAVLDGVRRHGDSRAITARVGPRTTVLRRGEASAVHLNDEELALLDEIDGRKTFEEIVRNATLTPPENVRLVYAFKVLGLVQPKEAGVKVRVKLNE